MRRTLVLLAMMALSLAASAAQPKAGDVCANRNEETIGKDGERLVCISSEPVWTVQTEPDRVGGKCRHEDMIGQAANGDILLCHDAKYRKAPAKEAVDNYDKLPATGNAQGDVRTILSTGRKVVWAGESWVLVSKPAAPSKGR